MKQISVTILFISIALFFGCRFCFAADRPRMVRVARYLNSEELNATVGTRVHSILAAQNIFCKSTGFQNVLVDVPADRADEALQLLAKAVKSENLPMTLMVRKGDLYVDATADSILQPKKVE